MEHGDEGHREQQRRQRQYHVGEPHQGEIGRAAEEARDEPDRHSDSHRDHHRGDADD